MPVRREVRGVTSGAARRIEDGRARREIGRQLLDDRLLETDQRVVDRVVRGGPGRVAAAALPFELNHNRPRSGAAAGCRR